MWGAEKQITLTAVSSSPMNGWNNEPGIYAIGDIVAGLPELAHVGSMAGLVVAARMPASTEGQ
jgi:pyruvate/2-oxoglutarate dehydrogenase complex dihydrolipoamide dehydrogenase (E3) component